MESFLADLRYAVRGLIKSPGFTLVAVVTLALGIGANTAIFSVVNRTLLRPPPFDHPSNLVMIWQRRGDALRNPVSYLDFTDWRSQSRSFQAMALFRATEASLAGGPGPERVPAALVTANFFRTLGVAPGLGRGFDQDEDQPGHDLVVVLSQSLWRHRFGGDPGVIGQVIRLEGKSFTVVGIAPLGLRYPENAQLWYPVSHDSPDILQTRGLHGYAAVGRLRPGVGLNEASAGMAVVSERLARQYPESNAGRGISLVPLQEDLVGNVRPTLLLLLAAVGFVLLIATANVANMMLARAASRSKEIAIRTALGASRSRLVRQLLTESVLLAVVGGAFGLLLATWGMQLLPAFGPAGDPPATGGLDPAVLGFTFLISALTGVLFGLIPAIQAGRPNLNASLADSGRTTGGVHRQRLRSLLVVAEVALSLLLLVGAGLMIRSFLLLKSVDPGFNPRQVLTAQLSLPPAKYSDTTDVIRFYEQLVGRIRALPGVTASALVSYIPLGNQTARYSFIVAGRPVPEPGNRPSADVLTITPDYFKALEIPLLEGRGFESSDKWADPGVVVINQTMAKRFWPGETAVGKRMSFGDPEDNAWLEVVGVVGDVKHRALGAEIRSQVYAPESQVGAETMTLVLRTSTDPLSLAGPVGREVLALDRDQPVSNVQTLSRIVDASITPERSRTWLLGGFAAVALLLAIIGVYGVVAYGVSQRVHEIGVRVALGAATTDVLKLIVRQGMLMVGIGVAVGTLAALALSRVLASLLFQIRPNDPATLAIVSLLVCTVALAACAVPARKAARVDPMVALRSE